MVSFLALPSTMDMLSIIIYAKPKYRLYLLVESFHLGEIIKTSKYSYLSPTLALMKNKQIASISHS